MMRSLAFAALAAGLAVPAAFAAAPAQAATFWACPRGYTFETNNGAARCHRGEVSREVALVPCPPGSTAVTNTGHDQCRVPINNTLTDRICPPGMPYITKPGTDACKQVTQAADDKPPSVPVSR